MRRASAAGFTLIEIAIAMALLVVGLTAVTTAYITALRWAAETRYQYSAIATAQQAVEAPWQLEDSRNNGIKLGYDLDSEEARGWLNGYYVVRVRQSRNPLPNCSSSFDEVQVQVYAGGTDNDGDLAHELVTSLIVPGGV